MKRGIEWHRDCLKNREISLAREEADLEQKIKKLERSRAETALYRAQVELAEKEGKDSFDSERYAIKRLCV